MVEKRKSVVVFGGSRGIGKAVAKRFLANGDQVAIVARNSAVVSEAAKTMGATSFFSADVANYAQVERVFDSLDCVDIVVNAAAIQGGAGAIGPIWETDPDSFKQVIDVNLTGSYHVLYSAIKCFRHQSATSGRIVMFSGGGSTSPRPRFSAYGASKTGVLRLVETCAMELQQQGLDIGVFAVAPGAVHTAMTEETIRNAVAAGGQEVQSAHKVMHSDGVPPELAADLCEFLAGPDSGPLRGRLTHVKENYKEYVNRKLTQDSGTLRRIDYPTE